MPAGPPPSTTTSYSPSMGVSRRSSRTYIQFHYAFESEARSGKARCGETQRWKPAAALAAETRHAGALRDRVAGEVVRQDAGTDFPCRAKRRRLEEGFLSRSLRRGAAHRPG